MRLAAQAHIPALVIELQSQELQFFQLYPVAKICMTSESATQTFFNSGHKDSNYLYTVEIRESAETTTLESSKNQK